MKKREWSKILLPTLAAVVLSVILSHYLVGLMANFEIRPQVQNQLNLKTHYRLYAQCLLLFLALISLPFIFSVFATKLKINRNNLGKIILLLEFAGLLLAYITTPPDVISTAIVFVVWQIPTGVNLITLLQIAKRDEESA